MNIDLKPFRFPNFLFLDVKEPATTVSTSHGTDKPKISVSQLTDEEAVDYWDSLRLAWLEHVAERRAAAVLLDDRAETYPDV